MQTLLTSLRRIAVAFLALCAFAIHAAAQDAQPFKWSWSFSPDGLSVSVSIHPSHYLYLERTSVSVGTEGKSPVKALSAPKGVMHDDELFGKTPILEAGKHTWSFAKESLAAPLKVSVEWQGCREASNGIEGACFMPGDLVKVFDTLEGDGSFQEESGTANQDSVDGESPLKGLKQRMASGYLTESEFLSFIAGSDPSASQRSLFHGKGLLAALIIAILGGLALNLTPCVLPMIPVNLAIIGAGRETTVQSRIVRASVYALGIAAAYGGLGAAVVLTGASFGQMNSEWWFNIAASFVFMVLGLAMFGLFNIDLSRFESKIRMPSSAHLIGVFALGALSAILAGACVAPVVIAALFHAASLYAQGDASGLLLPIFLGVGMALPWPFAAAGLSVLPKAGAWMLRVKQALGVLVLALGLYYAWTGGMLLLSALNSSKESPSDAIEAFGRDVADSINSGKPVLIDFWAEWCKNCVAMDATTLKAPQVRKTLEGYTFIKFDAGRASDPRVKEVLDNFDVKGLPSFVIIEPPEE